ncbi:alpha/beta hydrolase [Bombilactobacillus folatiphilus]|uniref:Alpha/beta hydrolase n=1 Tax=Bombilactobacillus folatiphilus TaxID=2923362 RepID=A0ABY4P7Q8_9LACO|nr:alpha/beta hydrolase [Bombilactobacillus folatiphilus]UQS81644.1 alpha/beta hydrolase [Bombilactobacillus folatiphilus]
MKIGRIELVKNCPDVTLTGYLLVFSKESVPLDDPIKNSDDSKRPAIIICPGGGFLTISEREAEPVTLFFAEQGYQGFVLRYTTYSTSESQKMNISKGLTVKQNVNFPCQLYELGQAMLLLHSNSERWHIDPQKIGICGFSSGGNIVALYSTRYNEPILTDYFDVSPEQLRPSVTIVGYPLTDYHFLMGKDLENRMKSPQKYAFLKACNIAYLGVEFPSKQLQEDVSPVNHVDKDTPPFFIWTTSTDSMVSLVHSLNMAEALSDSDISMSCIFLEKVTMVLV